jgi:hypothetical protein
MLRNLLQKLTLSSRRSATSKANVPEIKEADFVDGPNQFYPRALLTREDRAYEIFVLESDYNWFMIAARRLGDVGETVAVNIASLKCKQVGNTQKWSISRASLPKSYEGLDHADRYDVANAMLQYCVEVIQVEIGPEGYQTIHDIDAWKRWEQHCAEPSFQLELDRPLR